MKKLKIWEKLVVICLTMVFVTTLFLSFCISIEYFSITSRFVILGAIFIIANIATFFFLTKILLKRYNYKNRKGIKIYFYAIIIISSLAAMAILFYYNRWIYMLIYFILDGFYLAMVEKAFGKFRVTINGEHDKLSVGDLTSFNTTVQVIAKNKKVKSSSDSVKVGDIITISKDGETILTLDVINNKK